MNQAAPSVSEYSVYSVLPRGNSSDGRMLLWDPVASTTPVAGVLVGPAVNSACFSAGDPYALICAPQIGGDGARGGNGGANGKGNEDLVQIWDLR